jgi:hypothetical protein
MTWAKTAAVSSHIVNWFFHHPIDVILRTYQQGSHLKIKSTNETDLEDADPRSRVWVRASSQSPQVGGSGVLTKIDKTLAGLACGVSKHEAQLTQDPKVE